MQPIEQIQSTIETYFEGLFNGDVHRLRETFHPGAILSGDVKGTPYYRPLGEYLEGVANRKSPRESGETFNMRLLSVDVVGSTAIVKAHCPMLGFNYYDLLSLVHQEGRWLIAAKIFSHVD